MKKYKYLIVGQGLSGTLLAHILEDRGFSFKIIDTGINNSSAIAAGIINPIVFRRTTKSWMVDECYPSAIEMYQSLEEKLAVKFLHKRTIRRAFSSEQERDEWKKKASLSVFKPYINEVSDEAPSYLNQPFGNALVHEACYVDAPVFIESNRVYFQKNDLLITAKFNYDSVTESGCSIGEEHFEQIIFCEGYHGLKNPFFNYLPLTQTKGQLLSIELDTPIDQSEILNRKCFFLPLENGTYKAGSTYEWDNETLHTTEEAKEEIISHIENLIQIPFKIIHQEAGIRPTVVDRRPLVGRHPAQNNLFIFNGLGAKGYLLAPYFLTHFAEYLENKVSLNPEISIDRVKKKINFEHN